MSNFFQKPENALKRSEELISVGQKTAALDVLDVVIKSKRHRQWTPILEDILKKFLGLCTESRQPRRAKDGLIQYRGIASNHSQGPESILKVVTSFIGDGEKAVREAEEKAGLGADAVANLQDLEAEETPETMMVSVLTGDLSDTGRADRDNYVQWLRFLWESYRTCLEVLKNNTKLEELYADTAKKTFAFCVNYKRKVEFRRLKELLKNHLHMAPHSYTSVTSDTSFRLRVEIRAEQLNAATKLDLWQLAFESAEELHAVIPLYRKAFKSKMMLNYYDKLSQVFWVSENYLFHACAMQRIFNLTERQLNRDVAKGDTTREKADEVIRVLASKLLLGALSVPQQPNKGYELDFDPEKDKQQRMATLVGHTSIPLRKSIINDLASRNVLPQVFKELQGLYAKLETEFNPLTLGASVKPMLKFVEENEDLVKYLHPLKKIVLLKLVQQLGSVYQTMRIVDFARLADFMSLHDCEKFIVEAVANDQVSVRLDHKTGTLNFGDNTFEGPAMRTQLTNFGKGLQSVLDLIQGNLKEQARLQKAEAFKQLAESLDDERKMMMSRRQQIEERKEMVEREMHVKAMEDERRRKEEEEERRLNEEKRKEDDKKKREEERAQKEREMKEVAEKKKIKEQLNALKAQDKKSKGDVPKLTEEVDEDELKNLDKSELIKAKKEQEEKLKREAEERIQLQVQKLDHLERARRENERDLLQELFVKQKAEDKIRWEIESKQFMENHKKKHEEDVKVKERMLRMGGDQNTFQEIVKKRREEQHVREVQEEKERIRKERVRIKKEREEKERKEREEQERQEKLAEEKRRIFEEEKRKREEQAAILNATADKQRQREAEIEAKQRERDGASAAPDRDAGDRWGRSGGGGGGGGFGDRGDRPGGGGDGGRWGDRGGDRDDRLGGRPMGGSGRYEPPRGGDGGGGGRYEPPGSRGGGGGGFGDRGGGRDDRDEPRRGGMGDRFGGGDRGGFGDRGDRGPPERGGGGFGDRGDRDDRFGGRTGGGFGDRGDRGDRGGFGDRDRGGGGFGDRGDRGDRPDRGGFGGGGGFDRERRDDRGFGGRSDRPSEGRGDWGSSMRRDDDRPPRDDRAAPSERPRLNLAPRTVPPKPSDDCPAPATAADGDGFTAVQRKR